MNDTGTSPQISKRFTVEESNAMLPLVKSIVADISEIFRNVTGRRADLHRLLRKGSRSAGDVYDDEVAESRSDLQTEYDRIWQYREELESLGVFLRQSEDGEIEFPTMIDNRQAFYSWRMGEESVSYWRYADAPTSSRRVIQRFDSRG